ncbi:MAG: ComEC/Rec2 family competence protein, partial [Planctomycetota bacterium]
RRGHRLAPRPAGATGLLTRIVGGVRRAVGDARAASERMLWRRLGPQRAPVAAAMLIGARQGVPRDRSERFRRTGTLHVLVVSGLHVGLVVGLIYAASRVGLFPRRLTLLAVMAAIAAYAVLTGARPPVVRAAVLAEVMCLAAIGGRPVLAMNSLAAAALVVLAWNPAELFRSGPQLSFIAAATLIWFAGRRPTRRSTDPMKRLLAAADGWPVRAAKATARWAGLVLLATLLVWCVTAPLLLTRFHLLSPIAVPISVAVFPLVSIAVTSGVLLLLAGVLCPPLASPLAWCCGLSLDGLQALVEAAEAAPGATWWFGGPSAWWTIGAYALLAAGLLGATTRPRAIRWTQLALVWVIVGFLAAAAGDQRPRGVRCTFIAVGHGCSVLVESPGGGVVLYDAGSLGPPEAGAETIAGVLWSLGVHRIDAIVLSHADVDHYNAAPGLIERFAVGGLYVSPVMFDATDRAEGSRTGPAALLRAARTAGVPVHTLGQGDRLLVDDVSLLVLHPTVDDALLADNAKSMVVAVEHQGRRVLLPGDLEGEGLESLLLQQPYDCDLLLAPHHGSIRSGPPGFAAWSTPEWVVVSGGDAAAAASAGESYARSGATVTHTAEAGMVQFELGAEFCCQRWFSEGLRPVRLE